jgi:hypothetical protein
MFTVHTQNMDLCQLFTYTGFIFDEGNLPSSDVKLSAHTIISKNSLIYTDLNEYALYQQYLCQVVAH